MKLDKRSVKRVALRALRGAGLFSLARRLTSGKARVLMYHNFSPTGGDPSFTSAEIIRTQFEYLHKHYRVVPLLDIADRLSSGREMDSNTVALTIDDGRRNCYEVLFPLLTEFGFPATFFVVTSFINREDWIWTDKVMWLSEQTSAPEVLHPPNLAKTFYSLNRLRPELRNRKIQEMAEAAGASIPALPPSRYSPCSWGELREMAQSGLVEIGSHTVTHPILSSIGDEESWQELTQSRHQIEVGVGREVRCFCFPNGMPEDYRPGQVRQVQEAGYACSVIAETGLVHAGADPYRIPRIGMARKSDALEIAKYLDGITFYQAQLTRSLGSRNSAQEQE